MEGWGESKSEESHSKESKRKERNLELDRCLHSNACDGRGVTAGAGDDDKRFSHCLVAGIARGPRKVTRGMSKKKVEKRSRTMKPFVKYINVRHVFPTRYVVDMDLKKAVDEADLASAERKVDVKKGLKKIFEDKYLNQKAVTSEKKAAGSNYFFQKLRF